MRWRNLQINATVLVLLRMYKGSCECGAILCLCSERREDQTDRNPVCCTSDTYDESYESVVYEPDVSCETACETGSMVAEYRRDVNTILTQCPHCKRDVTLYSS